MGEIGRRAESFDFVGTFEQAWIQYKANFLKIIPFGLLASLPPALFLFGHIWLAILITITCEGLFILLLVDAINAANHQSNEYFLTRMKVALPEYLKNGVILSLFIFPLLVIGFVAFVIPSIIAFGLFIFSFHFVVTKHKFAVDACMESYRLGFGYRLHLFLLSMIFYSSLVLIYILTESQPFFFLIISGLLLPYFFNVVEEFFMQMEKK